jgi:hypothetical protein
VRMILASWLKTGTITEKARIGSGAGATGWGIVSTGAAVTIEKR